MNILAIGCHPDDIEVSCAGTLAKFARRGDTVTVCHVCNGNMGHVVIPPEELRTMRASEAKQAGALAGFEVVTVDYLYFWQASGESKNTSIRVKTRMHQLSSINSTTRPARMMWSPLSNWV